MTEEKLAELERLAENLTPAPWIIKHEFNVMHDGRLVASSGGHANNRDSERVYVENCANATFIAASREAVPELVKEVRRLRAKLAAHEASEDARLAIVQAELADEREKRQREEGRRMEAEAQLRGKQE